VGIMHTSAKYASVLLNATPCPREHSISAPCRPRASSKARIPTENPPTNGTRPNAASPDESPAR